MPISTPSPFDLATVDENGKAPDSKISSSAQAYAIASEYKRFDEPRRRKRIALFKSYQGFNPTEYSKIVEDGEDWQWNVNWRQLEFRVDNQKTSFIDLLTEKNLIANIQTKYGRETGEDVKWSELISMGYDRMMRQWPKYLLNGEQDLQDMLLYGKGIELHDDIEGFLSDHADIGDFLIPDNADIDFSNVECMVRMRQLSPNQLWDKIRDPEVAKASGWNRLACVEAMRMHLSTALHKLTTEQILHRISQGSVNVLSLANKKIDIFEVYVREYPKAGEKGLGKISKHIVLQDYAPAKAANPLVRRMKRDTYIDKSGFLFTKTGMYESWDDLVSIFTDSAGSQKWHEIKGLAERIYVQCRSYDITMNRIMDALFISMMFMIKGDSSSATKVLREIGLKPYAVLPEDVNPQQVKFTIPILDAQGVMRQVMGDTDAGMGAYRISNDAGAPEKTLGERQLDAAESAKLSGVQVRRYNEWQTIYHRKTFKRMLKIKSGERDEEIRKIFIDFCNDNGVPPEAYAEDNIVLVESNMISGAGSPSYKLMAAEKMITLTGMQPVNDGQKEAIKDAAAALNGRQNVRRYFPDAKIDITDVTRTIAFENAGLSDPYANPANFPVSTKDPQMEHIQGHMGAIGFNINLISQIAPNKPDKAAEILQGTNNIFGHLTQHEQLLAGDVTKKEMVKQLAEVTAQIKRQLDGLGAELSKVLEAQSQQEGEGLSAEQIKLQYQKALSDLDIYTKKMLADIKLTSIAQTHALRQANQQDAAATKLASQRMQANDKLRRDTRSQAQQQQESDQPEEQDGE